MTSTNKKNGMPTAGCGSVTMDQISKSSFKICEYETIRGAIEELAEDLEIVLGGDE